MDSEGEKKKHGPSDALLAAVPQIINIGLESFAQSLANEGARVVHVRWSPPAGGNPRLASLLTKLRS
jgi:FdrA protein